MKEILKMADIAIAVINGLFLAFTGVSGSPSSEKSLRSSPRFATGGWGGGGGRREGNPSAKVQEVVHSNKTWHAGICVVYNNNKQVRKSV